jgi:septum formation inhibitor MinC
MAIKDISNPTREEAVELQQALHQGVRAFNRFMKADPSVIVTRFKALREEVEKIGELVEEDDDFDFDADTGKEQPSEAEKAKATEKAKAEKAAKRKAAAEKKKGAGAKS